MTLRLSTGLRTQLLSTGSLKSIFAAGFLKIYSGTEPTSADDAVTGTLLCTISISSGGTGVNFDTAAVAGVLSKAPAEAWSGVNAASGTAGYFRHVAVGDTGALSTTQPRLQGAVAVVGGQLNVPSLSLTATATLGPVDYYSVALPAS